MELVYNSPPKIYLPNFLTSARNDVEYKMLIYQALSQWRSLTSRKVDDDRVKTSAPLKLYVWPSGAKFPGPSIHGECLATLAYLTLLSPSTSNEDSRRLDWELVQSWDPGNSPTCEFPMLQCPCGNSVAGFGPIVGHLKTCADLGYGHGDLDDWMNDDQKADCAA